MLRVSSQQPLLFSTHVGHPLTSGRRYPAFDVNGDVFRSRKSLPSGAAANTVPLRFGAYYPTYGALPLKSGVMFLYPGEKSGDIDVEAMRIIPVRAVERPDRQQVLAILDSEIRQEGYRWALKHQLIHEGYRGDIPAEIRRREQAQTQELVILPNGQKLSRWEKSTEDFWADVDRQLAKGRPDPHLLNEFKAGRGDRGHVLGWVIGQWRETLKAHILDDSREVPVLPFVPADKQAIFLKPDPEDASIPLKKLTSAELETLRHNWRSNPEVSVKLEKVAPGDYYGFLEKPDSAHGGQRYWVEVQKRNHAPQRMPDPWSTYQPHDVHGPSETRNLDYRWSSEGVNFWNQPKHLGRLMLKQIHVGTFTSEGTYRATLAKLKEAKQESERNGGRFEFTGIQFNPLSEFAGHWNWGYDGTYYFAPENAYGSPQDLQELVNWCHENKLAVVFDVVLNHFGPEGNYLGEYAGRLFDPHGSMGSLGGNLRWENPVALEMAKETLRFWMENFHADGFRFDLSEKIPDFSMQELCKDIHRQKPNIALIYEDYRPNDHVTLPPNIGVGANLQYNSWTWHAWKDFLEHLAWTGKAEIGNLCRSLWEGLKGQSLRPLESGFNYLMNHDTLSNDWRGRLVTRLTQSSQAAGRPAQNGHALSRLAVVLHQLMPGATLAFQGEDDARTSDFHFFTSFLQPDTNLGVFLGRGAEFKSEFDPGKPGCIGPEAFKQSKLSLSDSQQDKQYQALFHEALALRKAIPALWQNGHATLSFDSFYPSGETGQKLMRTHREHGVMMMHRRGQSAPSDKLGSGTAKAMFTPESEAFVIVNFSDRDQVNVEVPMPGGRNDWQMRLNTDTPSMGGAGRFVGQESDLRELGGKTVMNLPAHSLVVFSRGGSESKSLSGATLTRPDPKNGKLLKFPEPDEAEKNILRSRFALM